LCDSSLATGLARPFHTIVVRLTISAGADLIANGIEPSSGRMLAYGQYFHCELAASADACSLYSSIAGPLMPYLSRLGSLSFEELGYSWCYGDHSASYWRRHL